MMKLNNIAFLLFISLATSLYQSVNASVFSSSPIGVNQKSRILSAPEAVKYTWYFNQKKLDLQSREIPFLGSGAYTLETDDLKGNKKIYSITLATDNNGKIFRIFTIGDSTVQDYTPGYYPRKGWGQVLQAFFDSTVTVINKGVGGTSAKSFYNFFWAPVRDVLQPGDYVFIQFGINDANSDTARHTDPFTTFQGYLTRFIDEAKAKGAQPVLVATLRRNAWNADNPPTLYPAYHDYPVATRQLAQNLNIPLIDLDQMTRPLMESLGPDYTGDFMYMHLKPGEYPNYPNGAADDVHFQETGAIEMARLVVQAISNLGADTVVNKLIPHIKPMREVSASSNFPDGAILTRTASYPKGITVTMKAKVNTGYGFVEWQDSLGNQLTTNKLFSFTMDTVPLKYKAILDDNPQNLDCTGENNGTAYIDDCGECVGGTTGRFPCDTLLVAIQDTFKIKPVHSGLCIQQTATISQQACSSDKSQSWVFIREGEVYKIKNAVSGLYLSSDQIASGSYLNVKSNPVLWRIEKISDNIYQVIPSTNSGLAWDVYGASVLAGKQLLLYTRNSNNNQRFRLILDAPVDCNGETRGLATLDSCGICSGGSTGITPITDPDLCPTGLHEKYSHNTYAFSPNPFISEISLNLQKESDCPFTLVLFNMQGSQVLKVHSRANNTLVFGSELKQGLYSGKIILQNEVSLFKILKTN
ncbi:MAG: T9SS type A sorting domain-containing protein [Bacteroidales bacterium]|nr:T9SS type A sorting domain-containing protein [Bacteroidales bacterium]